MRARFLNLFKQPCFVTVCRDELPTDYYRVCDSCRTLKNLNTSTPMCESSLEKAGDAYNYPLERDYPGFCSALYRNTNQPVKEFCKATCGNCGIYKFWPLY